MKGFPPDPGGEDITWPDQVAPRGGTEPRTHKIKPQISKPFEVSGRGSVMVSISSRTASARTRDHALQSANTYETSRCQLL